MCLYRDKIINIDTNLNNEFLPYHFFPYHFAI